MPFGDSITAILHGTYQQPAIALTGLVITQQDAHGGRNTSQIFDNYSNNPSTGVGLGGVIPGQPNNPLPELDLIDGTTTNYWATAGNTLAQDLADIDIVTIFRGSNDSGISGTIGALGDAIGSGTYYGYLRNAIEGIQNANINTRIMWITPTYNTDSGSQTLAIVTAIKTICASYGIPVLDLFDNSGLNSLNLMDFTDGVHPSPFIGARYGRMIGRFIMANF